MKAFRKTNSDNVKDKVSKNRQAQGETIRHVLTLKQVEYIRERYKQGGILQKELAREVGVTPTQIAKIVNGKQWRGK